MRVEQAKIIGYLLNSAHRDGASKAHFFEKFGFGLAHWKSLAEALEQHGREREIVEEEQTAFGKKYMVECSVRTPDGRDPCIDTVWIIESTDAPRLVTPFPARRR